MNPTYSLEQATFGLLPEPERNPASYLTSCAINGAIAAMLLAFGTFAHHEIQLRKMETTEIYFPRTLPPPVRVKVKSPEVPLPPLRAELKLARLEAPKIFKPKVELKPEIKPIVMNEAAALPMASAKQQVVLAPQPKLAMAAAPAIAQQSHPSMEPVRLGDLNGVKPNPDATRPGTIPALGNPYGGRQGAVATPAGIVGSTGFGNGTRSGFSAGGSGNGSGNGSSNGAGYGGQGRVAAAGIPGMTTSTGPVTGAADSNTTTAPILISHAEPEYTSEARRLKIEGDVVLRVTITTSGQMLVHGVIRGLGHGLDEAALRSAPSYKFKPATKAGQPVEFTTNIIIKFQTA